MTTSAARVMVAAALAATVVGGWGCARRLQEVAGVANQPPVVSLRSTAVGVTTDATAEHILTWSAADPDGRVDHYLVTTDIRALSHEADGWVATNERSRSLQARRVVRGAARPVGSAEPEFDFFAVRAVDEHGAESKPAYRAFFAENVAPTVRITSPAPNPLVAPAVSPNFWIRWEGSDPDGPNGRPAKYKFKLLKLAPDVPYHAWFEDPDSLRRQFAPTFAGWDSISGDSTRVRFTNLELWRPYLFVITALDAEGAYDPVFSLEKNVLWLLVGSAAAVGPEITAFNSYFNHTFGGTPSRFDTSRVAYVDAATRVPFIVNWYARPRPGGTPVTAYRWALDIVDVNDDSPRRSPADLSHWSAWSPTATSVALGPFHGPALDVPHRLHIEAQDVGEGLSAAIVEFRFLRPAFDKDLLIVNDTNFNLDDIVGGRPDTLRAPVGAWPTEAELDTFLFAVGGVRWRMTPPGTVSPPGIFKGYSFDTLGTRSFSRRTQDRVIPFEVLSRYRNIVWITDSWSSSRSFVGGGIPECQPPISALWAMSGWNSESPLALWVRSGGRLWALGGGFAASATGPWDDESNDPYGYRRYTSLGGSQELVPGRFMYDLPHWRSEIRAALRVTKPALPAFSRAPFPPGREGTVGYVLLPSRLSFKQSGVDPLPPFRDDGTFYNPIGAWVGSGGCPVPRGYYGYEYLSRSNSVLEDKNPSARHADDVQTLDTLMVAAGAELPAQGPDPAVDRIVNPVMTYYHGAECGSVVFSGFDIWSWSRPDCVRLVDAVLTGIWGLSRSADALGPAAQGTQRKRD